MNADIVADAFHDEDYDELERITGLRCSSQIEFETKFELLQKRISELNKEVYK